MQLQDQQQESTMAAYDTIFSVNIRFLQSG